VLLPGGSGYFSCIQNMKLVTTRFKSGGPHEKHVVVTWNVGNHLSICFSYLHKSGLTGRDCVCVETFKFVTLKYYM